MLIIQRVDDLYFEDYFMGLLKGEREVPEGLEVLTGPVIRTLDEGVRLAVEHYGSYKPSEDVLAARKCIAKSMEAFHEKAGLMNDAVKSELAKMADPSALIIEVAHQPNIFPYSGFYRKIVMGKVLGERLRKELDVPVAVTFGFHDQDLSNPKWFRATNLPDLYSQNGVLTLKLPVSRKSRLAMYRLPKLEDEQVDAWKTVLENWLTGNIRRFNKMSGDHHSMPGLDENFKLDKGRTNIIRGRMRRVYELIDESHRLAGSVSGFNAFFTAKLVHDHWGYPILFYDYHSTARCGSKEYHGFLHERELLDKYSKAFSSSFKLCSENDISFDFNMPDIHQAPFWYQCKCGVKLEVAFDPKGPEFGVETCTGCGESIGTPLHALEADDIDERFSPRAAYRPLLIAGTLMPSIFVSGLSAQGFHMISRGLGEELGVPLAPFIIWPGGDEYRSLAKLVAQMTHAGLEVKPPAELTTKEKKLMENYKNTINCIPSIIDVLVNAGLKEVSEGWEADLNKGNNLSSTPVIPSIFDA